MPITWRSWWRNAHRPIWRRNARLRLCSTKFYPSETSVPLPESSSDSLLCRMLPHQSPENSPPNCFVTSGHSLSGWRLFPSCLQMSCAAFFLGHWSARPLLQQVYVEQPQLETCSRHPQRAIPLPHHLDSLPCSRQTVLSSQPPSFSSPDSAFMLELISDPSIHSFPFSLSHLLSELGSDGTLAF